MDAAMAEATAFRSLYRVSQDSPPQPKTELSTLKQADGEVKAKAAAAADKAAMDAALAEATAFRSLHRVSQDSPPQPKTEL